MLDKSVWASHKHPLKKYIFEYDGDREYYAGKTKVMSSNWAPGYQLAIDEEWNVIHFGAISCSRRRLTAKYGNALDKFIDWPRLRAWDVSAPVDMSAPASPRVPAARAVARIADRIASRTGEDGRI